ncbi:Uncharacterised protein [uncultured archaeon]|nr:Uncharacterised protein [uncultured archaeon]
MFESLTKRIGNTDVCVVEGDITKIPADAIITSLPPDAFLWDNSIDKVIRKAAGDHYHDQVKKKLFDLRTIVATRGKEKHPGRFDDIIFVIDESKSSLDKIIYAGLETATQQGYHKVLLPPMRMKPVGAVEQTAEETILRMKDGVYSFMNEYSKTTKLENITFVIYDDCETAERLASFLKEITLG